MLTVGQIYEAADVEGFLPHPLSLSLRPAITSQCEEEVGRRRCGRGAVQGREAAAVGGFQRRSTIRSVACTRGSAPSTPPRRPP